MYDIKINKTGIEALRNDVFFQKMCKEKIWKKEERKVIDHEFFGMILREYALDQGDRIHSFYRIVINGMEMFWDKDSSTKENYERDIQEMLAIRNNILMNFVGIYKCLHDYRCWDGADVHMFNIPHSTGMEIKSGDDALDFLDEMIKRSKE